METIKLNETLYIHKAPSYLIEDYSFFLHDMSDCGYILLGTHDLDIDIPKPTKDPIEAEIEMLKNQVAVINTEAYAKTQQLEQRISELTCIEFKGE